MGWKGVTGCGLLCAIGLSMRSWPTSGEDSGTRSWTKSFAQARAVFGTNIRGTIYLIHKTGNQMRRRNMGRILIGFDRGFHSQQLPGGL